jgi:predicted permease
MRHALRLFRRTPFWALSVSGTLALGIGSTIAMFAVGNAVLLRGLPYPEPDRLVMLRERNPQKGLEQERVTLADFADWRARAYVFEEIGYSFLWPGSRSTIVRTSSSVAVPSALVSSGWLRALGVRPLRGRIFTPNDDRRGASLVAVISDRFWRQQFGREPGVIGRTLTIDSYEQRNYQIVGILPAGLEFPAETDLWLSLGAAQFEPPSPGAGQRCCAWLEVMARLRPGVSVAQARTELNGIQSSLLAEHGPTDVNPAVSVRSLERYITSEVRRPILILMAAVGCVLLIACVNAANLLLARSGARKHELAIRRALGATRLRILGQVLIESLMLSAAGGIAGLALGTTALHWIQAMAPNIPRLNEARPDSAFVVMCAVTAVLAGIGFGLVPALQWAGPGYAHGRRSLGGDGRRVRDALVIGEVALATILLAGAALFLRSLERLDAVDPGFRAEGVVTARIDMSSATYSTSAEPGPNRPQVFFRRVLEQLRAVPGVIAVGGSNRLPLAGVIEGRGQIVATDDDPSGRSLRGDLRAVTTDYFRVMGIRLVHGRMFTEADTDQSDPVVIVDEVTANRYWPGRDPLGRRMAMINTRFPAPAPHWMRVVGVVGNTRHDGLDTASRPQFYLPYFSGEWRNAFLVMRTEGDPAAFVSTIRRQVAATDPNAVVTDVRPMEALITASTAPARFRTRLLTIFSALALLLAAAGVYGVVSCIVDQRTPEIGIRMAVGARAIDIFIMILSRAVALAGAGLAIGIGVALALRRVIASLLFETSPSDPLTLSLVAVILLAGTLLACWAPSWRAAQVDPMMALRRES